MQIKKKLISVITTLLFTFFVLIINTTICFAQTKENYKWLSKKTDKISVAPKVDSFLKSLEGNLRLLYCKYDKAHLVDHHEINSNELEIAGMKWKGTTMTTLVESDSTAMDLNIQFQLVDGNAKEAGIAVAFDFQLKFSGAIITRVGDRSGTSSSTREYVCRHPGAMPWAVL